MMLIGDPERVAIQFNLDPEHGGPWLFGKCCIWINNRQIGQFDLGTSLRDFLFALEGLARDVGNRTNQSLFQLDRVKLFNKLNNILFGCELSEDEEQAISESWARFNISIQVDVFDKWKMFLVEKDDTCRLLINHIAERDGIDEVVMKSGEFDDVLLRTVEALREVYEHELRKGPDECLMDE